MTWTHPKNGVECVGRKGNGATWETLGRMNGSSDVVVGAHRAVRCPLDESLGVHGT